MLTNVKVRNIHICRICICGISTQRRGSSADDGVLVNIADYKHWEPPFLLVLFFTVATYSCIFTHVIVLAFLSLFKIIFLGLQLDNGIPEFGSLEPELLNGHTIDFQGFDANAQRNLLFLFQLFFRLVAFQLRRRKVTLYRTEKYINNIPTIWSYAVARYMSFKISSFFVGTIRTARSFLVMVKLGPFLFAWSFIACIIAWRFFSDSSKRLDKKVVFFYMLDVICLTIIS